MVFGHLVIRISFVIRASTFVIPPAALDRSAGGR